MELFNCGEPTRVVWYQPLIGPVADKKIGVTYKTCRKCGQRLLPHRFRMNSNGYTYNSCYECNKAMERAADRRKRAS